MTKIKAVIFDMDGVLVDAKEWHFDALNRALALFGFHISQLEHVRDYDGLPTRHKLEMLTQKRGLPSSLHRFINQMKQTYLYEIVEQQCVPNPQHIETLHRLREEGFSVALASNSIRRSVDLLMERTDLAQFMQCTFSNEDVALPKPHPEIYQLTMQRLGFLPEECLVVEDGLYGIQAAQQAGAHVHRVDTVHDVHYAGICQTIQQLESQTPLRRAV